MLQCTLGYSLSIYNHKSLLSELITFQQWPAMDDYIDGPDMGWVHLVLPSIIKHSIMTSYPNPLYVIGAHRVYSASYVRIQRANINRILFNVTIDLMFSKIVLYIGLCGVSCVYVFFFFPGALFLCVLVKHVSVIVTPIKFLNLESMFYITYITNNHNVICVFLQGCISRISNFKCWSHQYMEPDFVHNWACRCPSNWTVQDLKQIQCWLHKSIC